VSINCQIPDQPWWIKKIHHCRTFNRPFGCLWSTICRRFSVLSFVCLSPFFSFFSFFSFFRIVSLFRVEWQFESFLTIVSIQAILLNSQSISPKTIFP
jgi:hypothetical protein